MSDPREAPASPPIASGSEQFPNPSAVLAETSTDNLEVARRFLEDEEVKRASRDKKIEFLTSKNVKESDIQALLGEAEHVAPANAVVKEGTSEAQDTADPTDTNPAHLSTTSHTTSANPESPTQFLTRGDRPPVVTYPEFLTKSQGPPPLVTAAGLLNTLYGLLAVCTAFYGTSKYVISPMVDNLTDARVELHNTASGKLEEIVNKLGKTVSVVPSKTETSVTKLDDTSDIDDPYEVFHRDVGTQTSFGPNPSSTAKPAGQPESDRQADRLSKLARSLSALKDDFRSQSNGLQDVKALLNVFRDDLDGMTYIGNGDLVGSFDMQGKLKRSEPEDEIRKVRDNIRRIKGVLLSTRNFPVSTR